MVLKRISYIFYICIFIYLLAEYSAIPENMYMTAGEDHNFIIGLPFSGELRSDSIETISVNNKKAAYNENIGNKAVICSQRTGSADIKVKFLGLPVKNINLNFTPENKLYAVGRAVGICVDSKGVLVLGTGKVKDKNGSFYAPAENILRSGDIITKVNNISISNKEELTRAVNGSNGKIYIDYIRDNNEQSCTINAVRSVEDNGFKLGIWVRDSTQGIGTITYYDRASGKFGALGHPINDVDTGKEMEIKGGEILSASIDHAEKGQKGKPGSLQGNINYSDVLGYVEENDENGIYGTMTKEIGGEYVPIGYKSLVEEGDAVILSNITSENVERYTIHIDSINRYNTSRNKNFVISVTDKKLIDKTGGIIQGMSGCPIIQNGRLIGAVTHVFVNNPTKGYGIFIENMLN